MNEPGKESKRQILIVDDDQHMRGAVSETLKREGYSVLTAKDGKEAQVRLKTGEFTLVVTDVKMPKVGGLELLQSIKKSKPELPVVVMTGYGTIENAVEAMKFGAVEYLVKPFTTDVLIEAVQNNADKSMLENPDEMCRIPGGTGDKSCIVTRDPATLNLLKIARNIAASNATVLLRGESGTGKELFAYYIHKHSRRADKEFVAVNCAALPENLLESELFGHEKGSFTGATNATKGKFEVAEGGTLLLDEISEMEPRLQAKLLRVIQEREIDRIGRNSPIPVDIRIIATTNRDLEKEVAEGRFREDLYYRLNVIPITLPPLRERHGDIEVLSEHFISKYKDINGNKECSLSESAVAKLRSHNWPGNIRELQNIIERGVLLAGGVTIKAEYLLLGVSENAVTPVLSHGNMMTGKTLKSMEKDLILTTLDNYDQNRTQAAKALGISIRTLRNKLNEYKNEGEQNEQE